MSTKVDAMWSAFIGQRVAATATRSHQP